MEVGELLIRVAEVYGSCRSYRDRGEMTRVRISGTPPEPHTSVLDFETAWIRPDHFRFEVTGREGGPLSMLDRHVVWWNGARPPARDDAQRSGTWREGDVRWWWAARKNEIESFGDLSRALGPVEVGPVPKLLAPQTSRGLAGRWRMGSEEDEGGVRCFVLEGRGEPTSPHQERAWIDARTHLIRRFDSEKYFLRAEMLETHMKRMDHLRERMFSSPSAARSLKEMEESGPPDLDDFSAAETIRYWPELDPVLAPEIFEFEPPVAD